MDVKKVDVLPWESAGKEVTAYDPIKENNITTEQADIAPWEQPKATQNTKMHPFIQRMSDYVKQNVPPEVWAGSDESPGLMEYIAREPTQQGERFSIENTLRNVQPSIQNTAAGLLDPQTYEFLAKAIAGTGQMAGQGILGDQYVDYPKAIADHYKNILSDPSKAIEEDPLTLLDFYGLARGGMGAARNISKVIPEDFSRGLYQRGAKFSTTKDLEFRNKITDTALERGILPTDAGIEKLNGLLGDYSVKVNKLIDDSTASGTLINRSDLLRYSKDLYKKFGGIKPSAQKNVKKLQKLIDDDFKTWMPDKKKLTPIEAQEWKHAAYERVHKWGQQSSPKTSVDEAYNKSTGRAAKELIEENVPGVAELNKGYAGLLNLKDELQKSAARIENRDLFNLTDVTGAGLGAAVGGGPGAVLGGSLMAIRHPTASARLGVLLNRMQKPGSGLLRMKPRDAFLAAAIAEGAQGLLSDQ